MDDRAHLFEMDPQSLSQWCAARAMPAFRAGQILDWVYAKGTTDPARMTNLPPRDRARLAEQMRFLSGDVVARQTASDGTDKLLVRWHADAQDQAPPTPEPAERLAQLPVLGPAGPAAAGRQTECVMIPTQGRRTACISSQVGCPVGCRFCASGVGGLEGNLSAGRIVEQVWLLRWRLGGSPGAEGAPATEAAPAVAPPRISNVVFMGMGEPLANLGPVVRAVRALAAPWGMGISARKITISTVGLPKAIEKLAEQLDLPVTLALSLHAPTDQIRRRLIPWAQYTTIADLLSACQLWFERTGREITLEYTLLADVNDRPQHAEELARLAKSLRANVNLIRYNEVRGMPFSRPRTQDVRLFQETLRSRGVNTHIRASRGRDIAAACGQLRHQRAGEAAPASPPGESR